MSETCYDVWRFIYYYTMMWKHTHVLGINTECIVKTDIFNNDGIGGESDIVNNIALMLYIGFGKSFSTFKLKCTCKKHN